MSDMKKPQPKDVKLLKSQNQILHPDLTSESMHASHCLILPGSYWIKNTLLKVIHMQTDTQVTGFFKGVSDPCHQMPTLIILIKPLEAYF